MSCATLSLTHGLIDSMEVGAIVAYALHPAKEQKAATKADPHIDGVHKFLNFGHIAHLLTSDWV
jgi:hypothetical protein